MLNRFIELEIAIKKTFALIDVESLPTVSTDEWKILKEFIILLKPYYDVTKLMCAEKYTTLSLVMIVTNGLETV